VRIAFIGIGALGGYFGGRLAKAGNDVIFIARGATLEALRKDGLRVESPLGDFALPKVQATGDPTGVMDAVFITTKAWQVTEAALQIRSTVGPETVVVPLAKRRRGLQPIGGCARSWARAGWNVSRHGHGHCAGCRPA